MASSINASTSGAGGVITTADNTGILNLQTASTNAVTVDASQNVGIGTTSPSTYSAKFAIKTSDQDVIGFVGGTTYGMRFGANSSFAVIDGVDAATGTSAYNPLCMRGSQLLFNTGGTERMRIASNGDVLIGQTTNPATAAVVIKVQTLVANGVNAQITSNTGTSYPWSNYNATGTYVGGITCTSSATAFPTSSDKRLKKNISDAPPALDKILTAQIVSHDWIDDDAHVEYGFVAQDLQGIIPQAVVEGTDKEDGSINMPWGVDYSKIVPLLTKAIQEQQTIINDLKARIETLEAK
jgi:hypothetical protein